MHVELINIGSELLLGFVLNTHQQWLCRRLADLGYPVAHQVSIPDSGPAIQEAVRTALSRADLILVTGGLGPTSDDLTRQMIADLLGVPLHEDPSVAAHIEQFFAARNKAAPAQTRVQALVPEGAVVLPNRFGTAPGLVMEAPRPSGSSALLVMLPGPPRELHPMFTEQVAPLLRQKFPSPLPFLCRTYKTTGLGESFIEEKIGAALQPLAADGLELAYCARVSEVDVRVVCKGACAEKVIAQAEQLIHEHIGDWIFSCSDEPIEAVVLRLLLARQETIALAESCTGGFIAHRITNVPGASGAFLCSFVTYSNDSKQRLLGVSPDTLAQFGAVSEPVARQMAEQTRNRTGATYAIAVTGIAGPTGGTAEKPVGSVYIALAGPNPTEILHKVNAYDRETFKFVTSQQAFDLLRRRLAHRAIR